MSCLRINIYMQTFSLPRVLGSERLDTVLSLLFSLRDEEVIHVDWSKVQKIEPAGLAILSILFDQSIEKKCKLIHENIKPVLKKKYPLILFTDEKFSQLPSPVLHDFNRPNAFLLCCQGGVDLRYKENLARSFFNLDEDLLFSVQLVFNELIQNAVDHSTSERYYIYFGLEDDEVHFGVLDMGVSLPAKMEQKYNAIDDINYLELSLKEGISTRRQRVGGLGLFHTFHMIQGLKGKFVFISRDGQIRRYFSQRKVNRMKLKHRLNGTWVMFTFKNQEQDS